MPTVNEIIVGLVEWMVMQTEQRTKNLSVNSKRRAIKNTKNVME